MFRYGGRIAAPALAQAVPINKIALYSTVEALLIHTPP